MRTVILRFLTLQPINLHPMVYWGMAALWIILVVASIMSLRTQLVSAGVKVFWLAVILLLPLAGVAFYALWCLLRADYSFLRFVLGPSVRREAQKLKDSAPALDER